MLILFVLAIGFAAWWFLLRSKPSEDKAPKMAPIALKKHSDVFSNSVDKMVTAYFNIKNAFVESDTATAKQHAQSFISLLDSIPLDELKKDTAGIFETAKSNIADIKSNTESLLKQTDITEMRHDFSTITEMMYPSFFKVINYEGPNIYCKTAQWLLEMKCRQTGSVTAAR